MSSVVRSRLRVRLEAAASAGDLTEAIDAALTILADACRIRRVGPEENADVVHAVGTSESRTAQGRRRVQTVDHLPLRSNGSEPPGWWRRRARGLAPSVTTWLVHGRTAERLLVASGVASGDRVYCLPLLPPSPAGPHAVGETSASQSRAGLRQRLGLAPGIRLAVGLAPGPAGVGTGGWVRSLESRHRSDVATGALRQVPGVPGHFGLHVGGQQGPSVTGELGMVLAAADIFVAGDSGLAACTPALAAAEAGVPIVAATTDSAQDLVLAGAEGRLARPNPDALADAVASLLDEGVRRGSGDSHDAPSRTAHLAHELLRVYRQVRFQPQLGGAQ